MIKTSHTNKIKPSSSNLKTYSNGFTIVELLVVIVIIGILAAITIVSYNGISQRVVISSLQSDLDNASKKLRIYYQLYGSYPTAMNGSNCPTAPTADTAYCLKSSTNNTLAYSSLIPTAFRLTGTNTNNASYAVNENSTPTIATAISGSSVGSACPSGFIPVPGSGTYNTNDFCIMKYAASQVGASNVPTSIPSVYPWVSISQTTAITNSRNVAGCTGCHLVTDAEYMTVAQNVLSVASNWSGGSVGSGYFYSGHNDMAPSNMLVPDPSDSNGYAGETNTGGNQRRTLTLTNGQVIWDLAGNVAEWTDGTVAGGQPGVSGIDYGTWIEWPNITTNGGLAVNLSPSGTGLTGSNTWNSSKGVGMMLTSTTDNSLHGILRGGSWSAANTGGVFYLNLNNSPGSAGGAFGFRVAR